MPATFIGHTMALPASPLPDAIVQFQGMGLDAIEIAMQDGTPFTSRPTEEEVGAILAAANANALPVVTVTPYYLDINSDDEQLRAASIAGALHAVDVAGRLGAHFVRAYGGREVTRGRAESVARCADALRALGARAQEHSITVLVENHMGTLTRTGAQTREMLEVVRLDNVRALYDPANVLNDTDEDVWQTLDVQDGLIAYTHVKDYYLRDGKRIACPVGEGVVPWTKILQRLDPNGFFSFEYEQKWHPDQLPPSEIGVPASLNFVKKALQS